MPEANAAIRVRDRHGIWQIIKNITKLNRARHYQPIIARSAQQKLHSRSRRLKLATVANRVSRQIDKPLQILQRISAVNLLNRLHNGNHIPTIITFRNRFQYHRNFPIGFSEAQILAWHALEIDDSEFNQCRTTVRKFNRSRHVCVSRCRICLIDIKRGQ